MNKQHCMHFSMLPMGMKVLYTGTLIVLGCGYMFAMIYIFASQAGRDGSPGLSVNDLIIAYSGSKKDSKIESALKGPMINMLPQNERSKIIAWVRRGAKKKDFASSGVEDIVGKRCLMCHDGSNPHIPKLKGYENIKKVAELDHGMDIFTLVRVSHIHLFGITFIFFIMGSIFIHAYVRPLWLKCIIIIMPFISIVLDIGSWYLTKVYTPFAYVVMGSGVLMGASFATEWIVSMWQMWIYKPSQELKDKGGVVS